MTSRTARYDNMQGKDRRLLILEEVRAGVEEKRASQMVGMRQQGAWVPKSLDLGSLRHAAESIQPLHQRWRHQLAPSAQCRETLEHILSCCPIALGEGRYRWRHNQFLKAVADSICRCGLQSQREIPDIVLLSVASEQVILLELTVPWEDRMDEANERKRAKYSELLKECWSNSWRTRCQPIKVGCRGFVGQSLCRAYKMRGMTRARQRRGIQLATDTAEAMLRWLWIRRGEVWHVG